MLLDVRVADHNQPPNSKTGRQTMLHARCSHPPCAELLNISRCASAARLLPNCRYCCKA